MHEQVAAMVTDSRAPTAALDEFTEVYEADDNIWWQIGCGHHMNLFDAALDRIEELTERLNGARDADLR